MASEREIAEDDQATITHAAAMMYDRADKLQRLMAEGGAP